jgi:Na+-transporting methylmalonyl-CoA/oxaloacetate decarboxylase beta subunit
MKKIKIITAICYLLTAISALFPYGLAWFLGLTTPSELFGRGCSIGVIGGADGPTQIFISQGEKLHSLSTIFGALSILGTVFIFILNGKGKRRRNQ